MAEASVVFIFVGAQGWIKDIEAGVRDDVLGLVLRVVAVITASLTCNLVKLSG